MIRFSRISVDDNQSMLIAFSEIKRLITGDASLPQFNQGRISFKKGSTIVSYSKFTFSIEAEVSTVEHLELIIRCVKKAIFHK